MNNTEVEDIIGYTEYTGIEAELGFGSGLTLLGALGCDYGDYRVEGELGYQNNNVDALDIYIPCCNTEDNAVINVDLDGDITVLSLLMNGYYDIDLGGGVELSPTVGVGLAQVSMGDVTITGISEDYSNCCNGDNNGGDIIIVPDDPPFDDEITEVKESPQERQMRAGDDLNLDVHEVTFAYQAGIGLGIPVAENIMLDARYRYFATTDFTVLVANTNIESHNALLGLRVMF
uniref:Porin, opacity type n=1 Tax=Chlorobium phaeobacteroides (strain BS1) TaxID=331678 RepID=B3ELR7_CHLPB